HWSPQGQSTTQRRAMASFIKRHDPYRHPVLIHTHSTSEEKTSILSPLLGFKDIDGLSFQVGDPTRVNREVRLWREAAMRAGHPWLITMDEIGPWQRGAVPDADEHDDHKVLRREVLWGSLLGGAAGVEWYFGAHFPHNDLTAENWRTRGSLWKQSRTAAEFFETLPLVDMAPCTRTKVAYCLAEPGKLYVAYRNAGQALSLDLNGVPGEFDVRWFNPIQGGELVVSGLERTRGDQIVVLDSPPDRDVDWVAVVTRRSN
ncbi:MAG: putative collagen-binding domain-containing protein, partial [Pseudomonadota bacterium]